MKRAARRCLGAIAILTVAATTATAQDTTSDVLQRASKLYRTATSLRAAFTQTLTSPGSKLGRTATGEFLQRDAAHFALRFTDPAGDAIVNDGETVWVYLPSTAKGQVMKLPSGAGAGLDFFSALLNKPREHYTVTTGADETVGTHATAVFLLSPKDTNTPFTRAKLWIGTDDATLWQLETVEPSGMVRRISFSSVRFNVALPKGALTFTVPDGIRVIDQAAILGGKP